MSNIRMLANRVGELAVEMNNVFATIASGFIDASRWRLMRVRFHRRHGLRDSLLNHGSVSHLFHPNSSQVCLMQPTRIHNNRISTLCSQLRDNSAQYLFVYIYKYNGFRPYFDDHHRRNCFPKANPLTSATGAEVANTNVVVCLGISTWRCSVQI